MAQVDQTRAEVVSSQVRSVPRQPCASPRAARERIREAATRVVDRCQGVEPLAVSPLYTIRTPFESSVFADYALRAYQALARIDETTGVGACDELDVVL